MKEIMIVLFGWFTLACGIGVVFSKSPVYSAFSLILCFFGLSGIYILWGATFVAMIQILIYTGAIVVLFVFVVMLLDLVKATSAPAFGWATIGITGATVLSIAILLLRALNRATFFAPLGATNQNDMRSISKLLFMDYLWPFEVLSIFLLALIVAIFALTRPEDANADVVDPTSMEESRK
jgi:NADH-quinone oxidoreductase subunit J